MKCEDFQNLVLDGGRSAGLPREAAEHAGGCEHCSVFLADMQAIEKTLGREAYPPVPSRVRSVLMRRFDEELGEREPRSWFRLPSVPKFVLAGAAVCAVALMVWVGIPHEGAEPEMEVTLQSVTVPSGYALPGFAAGFR